MLVLVFLFAPIVSIGVGVFLSPPLAEAQGSEKGILHRHHPLVQEAIGVHHRHHNWLMRIPDVVGTGVGIGPDGLPAIKVFTARHGVKGIPDWLESTPVHVKVTGRVVALGCPQGTAGRCDRPVPIGVSTGHPAITAGTIAARVRDLNGNVYALSNNHVYANQNEAILGDSALQPGPYDGGVDPADKIGELYAFQPIDFSGGLNTMDAAIVVSSANDLGNSTLGDGYGTPNSQVAAASIGLDVRKYGRTTGLTHGQISEIDVTVDVCYESWWIFCMKSARFVDQIAISPISPATFSAGGDSGSLIVTENGNNPVGLLFAGSDTITFANRIDLVLNHFGVTVDGGAVVEPTIDVAVTGIDVPAPVVVDQTVTVTVTVENRGTQAAGGFNVTLRDINDAVPLGTNSVLGLDPGASATVDFSWTPSTAGTHILEASHHLAGDENANNDMYTKNVNVLLPPSGPQLQLWKGLAYTDRWTTVQLGYEYGDEMVVVCSPNYDLSAPGPAIARVRNASGSSFEVGLGRPWYGTFGGEDFSANVYCMVLRQGVYTTAEDGVKMEAVKLANFTSTDHAGSWSGQRQTYHNAYIHPVVVGQVVSPDTGIPPSYCPDLLCEGEWSVFWSRGTAVTNPPSGSTLYVGRHTGEDTNGRVAETLMYVVIESGTGTIENRKYMAALGGDTVRGMQNRPPFNYSLSGLASASAAIVSQAGMDGADGGWAVLYGSSAVSATRLRLAIDEDWYLYSERNHTTEQVSYIVFE
jgi:hypothetical protein